jgi:hypothetical protein
MFRRWISPSLKGAIAAGAVAFALHSAMPAFAQPASLNTIRGAGANDWCGTEALCPTDIKDCTHAANIKYLTCSNKNGGGTCSVNSGTHPCGTSTQQCADLHTGDYTTPCP